MLNNGYRWWSRWKIEKYWSISHNCCSTWGTWKATNSLSWFLRNNYTSLMCASYMANHPYKNVARSPFFKQQKIQTTNNLYDNGPKGRPNNLPQPAWCLTELFFWSDLSWSRAYLCSNFYVISTRFSLLGAVTSCTRYLSYVGIERIIHNQIIRNMLFVKLGPTGFQLTCYCTYFLIFE